MSTHFPATNGSWLSSYDKAQKIIQPKPFGSIYYKVSPMVHYVPPIQTQLRGITKKSEINTQERTVLKLDITCLQLLSSFLLSFPSLLFSPPSFSSLLCAHLPLSLPKLIYMKEGVMRTLIYLKQNRFSKCLDMCVIMSSLQKLCRGGGIGKSRYFTSHTQ